MKSPFSIAVGLMWLSLPLAALDFLRVWDQLPARMAIHFDINWRANGWASRAAACELMLGMLVFMLITFSVVLWFMRRTPQAGFMSWLMLGFFFATLAFICGVNHWVIRYNLTEGNKQVRYWHSTSDQVFRSSQDKLRTDN